MLTWLRTWWRRIGNVRLVVSWPNTSGGPDRVYRLVLPGCDDWCDEGYGPVRW